MSNHLVLSEQHGHVRLLTFNRVDKRNAFDNPMYRATTAALQAAHEDPATRVVVLTGAGETFCAGQDFSEMHTGDGAEHGFPACLRTLIDYDKPIVAAVNGVGIGLGLTILLHTDVNYIAEGARLRAPFVTLGVVPEAASSLLLPIVVGQQRAAELLFTARWIDAAESVAMGLTYAVVPRDRLLETAMAKAAEIAANPPAAVRHTKRLLRTWRRQAILDARQREDEAFAERLGTPENMEAIAAFFERRPPKFD
ncbi:MAG: enoyl-CoA hydratase-related protein [Candidatus Binatia bacterium]